MTQSIAFESGPCAEIECPLCGALNSRYFVKLQSTDHVLNPSLPEMTLLECSECKSKYWENPNIKGYIDSDAGGHKASTDHYVLVGAGIHSSIDLLSNFKHKNTLLEIGCGYGFALDYWSNYLKKSSIGLEAAYYGKEGKKSLGVNILNRYLSKNDDPIGSFDVVFSSEVIEHVPNPLDFLLAIKNNLANDGTLILTTPAAEFITNEAGRSALLAALSPGSHYFILSKEAMLSLLKAAGFNSIEIEIRHERLIAIARLDKKSHTPLSFDRNDYINYLYHLLNNAEEIVKEGALFRLFKELVNAGKYDEARKIFVQLNSIIINKYEIDLDMLTADMMRGSLFKSLDDYLYRVPPYISIVFFYLGVLNSHRSEQLISKLICFSLSYQLGVNIVASVPNLSQEAESILPVAGGELINAMIDNLDYLDGYAKGFNSGMMGEFLPAQKVQYLKSKLKNQSYKQN